MYRLVAAALALWATLAAASPSAAQFNNPAAPSCSGDINPSCSQVTGQHLSSPIPGEERVLCSIRAANFNSTADQTCVIPASVTAWAPLSMWATNCSASLTLAVGGIYPSPGKGGTPMVAATQVYTAVTGNTIIAPLTLAAGIATTRFTIGTVYLSLTTAQGSAATCDFYVMGADLT